MGAMSGFKHQQRLVKDLEKQGFRVEQTRKCHYRVYSPNGRDMTTLGSTPGDHRSLKNQLAILRKMGYEET